MLTGRSTGFQGRSTHRHDFPEDTMTTATSTPTTPRTWLIRAPSTGAVAGVIASLVMAACAMIAAATYQGLRVLDLALPHRRRFHFSG